MGQAGWSNLHIPERKPTLEYHRVVADLVSRHTSSAGTVVDIGAGLGNVLELIAKRRPDVELHAADTSKECLARIGQVLPRAPVHHLDEEAASIRELGSGRFDTAVLCHSLEHTRRPLDVLDAVGAILKPSGRMILAVPNVVRPTVMLYSLLGRHYVNRGHVYAWDRSHWRNFLETMAGLHVDEYTQDELRLLPHRVTGRLSALRSVQRGLGRLVPGWAHTHIAVARPPQAQAAGSSPEAGGA